MAHHRINQFYKLLGMSIYGVLSFELCKCQEGITFVAAGKLA
jgi:hypothetical protein